MDPLTDDVPWSGQSAPPPMARLTHRAPSSTPLAPRLLHGECEIGTHRVVWPPVWHDRLLLPANIADDDHTNIVALQYELFVGSLLVIELPEGHGGALIARRGLRHEVHGHGLCALPLPGGATGMENANDTT
jgi:hypothetical protein